MYNYPMKRPSYERGGMVQPPQQQINFSQEADKLAQNPELVQRAGTMLNELIASGEVDAEEIETVANLARLALDNPDMYPEVRNQLIQLGAADPEDIPEQFDPGMLTVLVIMGDLLQRGGKSVPPVQQALPSMADGGPLPVRSGRPDGVVPINAHEGEYVVPAHVVRAKGTEFFDRMLQKYNKG